MLKQGQVAGGTRSYALNLLWELAGASSQVPKSYLVGKLTSYKVKGGVVASGRLADIREGELGDKVVAVKTIRMSEETKVEVIHKVRKLDGCSIPRRLIDMAYRIQDFCKECVLWMNVSHPNILQLIAVEIEIKAHTGSFSMVSEMMTNGNILKYIRVKKADRLRLVRLLIINIPLCWIT